MQRTATDRKYNADTNILPLLNIRQGSTYDAWKISVRIDGGTLLPKFLVIGARKCGSWALEEREQP